MPHYPLFQSLGLPRRYLQTRNNVETPTSRKLVGSSLRLLVGSSLRLEPTQWVIARSLCLYRLFVMGDIPIVEQKNALNIRIRQWSPFQETGRYVVWNKEIAQVWIWDEAVRFNTMKSVGVNLSRIFPETILHLPLINTECKVSLLRLISCMEGIEAQIWQEGILIASHWWQEIPPPKEWARFLLAHDLNPETELPETENISLLNRPWGKSSDTYASFRIPNVLLRMTLAILIFFLIWQGVVIYRWYQAKDVLNEKIVLLTQDAEPLLDARTLAVAYRDSAEKLTNLTDYPSQLHLIAGVAETLSPNIQLAEWHYNQGNLTFTLKGVQGSLAEGKDLDPRYYIETYQKIPYFKEVSAERGVRPGELVVRIRN